MRLLIGQAERKLCCFVKREFYKPFCFQILGIRACRRELCWSRLVKQNAGMHQAYKVRGMPGTLWIQRPPMSDCQQTVRQIEQVIR
ncbi:hypothetical protein Pan153_35730 [Gimesia panareensis]|uniref:Uncharacterized protein n=1 Tax=Gimesia panareensis TaxID=2527978 RepID=A0A518FRE2_9PLAN|nr:hypothetical protein Pan153_35730 [Gimesia panareensis]